jgi:hypothetical protein
MLIIINKKSMVTGRLSDFKYTLKTLYVCACMGSSLLIAFLLAISIIKKPICYCRLGATSESCPFCIMGSQKVE